MATKKAKSCQNRQSGENSENKNRLTCYYQQIKRFFPIPGTEPIPKFLALPDADHGDTSPLNMTTIYVSTTNPLNAGSYYLKDSLFIESFLNLCVLDAAKIHMQPNNAPALYLGEDMNLVLSPPLNVYIRFLQKKGIKVLLCIFGDGQDVARFQTCSLFPDFKDY